MSESRAAIVLAAGKGKRMKSDLPKVLHSINGRPIIQILLDTLAKLNFERIVIVIGYKGEMVKQALAGYPVDFVWQTEQLGTGHAVEMAREALADFSGTTLVALGDVPFLSADSIEQLFLAHESTAAAATCLSAVLDDASGYGRIIRRGETDILEAIVEEKDATDDQRAVNEINTGTFCFDNQILFDTLRGIDNRNAQGEYYLTDCIKILYDKGLRVSVKKLEDPSEGLGINSAEQLEALAQHFTDRD